MSPQHVVREIRKVDISGTHPVMTKAPGGDSSRRQPDTVQLPVVTRPARGDVDWIAKSRANITVPSPDHVYFGHAALGVWLPSLFIKFEDDGEDTTVGRGDTLH